MRVAAKLSVNVKERWRDISMQTNKTAAVRIFEEAINQNKPELAEQLFHEDFVDHNPIDGQPPGRAAGRFIVEFLNSGGRTAGIVLHQLVAEGDLVGLRWTAGPLERPAVEAIVMLRFESGRVIERWAAFIRHEVG